MRAEVGQPRSGYVHERNPSRTSHACGKVYKGNRVARGLYRCACGWKAQADPNGALNLDEGTFPVSPVFTGVARTWKGSRGRGARPGALSFRLRWPTVHQPSCFPKGAPRGRESLPSSLIG
ncbi:zinc ribbon domain-containing protein [Thermus sp.]|uniref:zinc ribbon domain-containing protein n=1 Tax=Thermus sp. TaxID=275 RepID=UPI00332AC316